MSVLALSLVLLQAAAAAPSVTPTPLPAATPTPTPRPASAGPRTLQDVARERRLAGSAKGKGTLGTVSGSATSSPAPGATPAPDADAAATASPAPNAPSEASVRVTSATNDGVVDATGGVRVSGTVRNTGIQPACNVVVTAKILDSRGNYLASVQVAPDVASLAPGEVASFHAIVQAPPGVRGARSSPDRKDVTEGSTTMSGEWKLLGGTEASVASASEDCAR